MEQQNNPFEKVRELLTEPDVQEDAFLLKLKKEIDETKDEIIKQQLLVRYEEEVKNYNGDDKIISFEEIADEIKNSPPPFKITTNITGLDTLLHGGFMYETVTTISATPKSGKTSYCMYLTTQMKDQNPLWLALEESTKTLIRKLIKFEQPVPHGYAPATKRSVTLRWIEAKIFEAKVKFDSKVVFIDQLDFIVPQDNQGDRHDLKIAQTMRELHNIAVRYKVAIFLICHLNQIEPDQKPTTRNLRGSTSIWGEADNCIFLWRECKRENGSIVYSNNVEVSLQANREDGDTGIIGMVFDKGVFKEYDWMKNDPELDAIANQSF
jgi:replicative DNA helicase